jgi:hypothetical protein
MDKLSFGINFIRNGRTILFNDQNIFTYSEERAESGNRRGYDAATEDGCDVQVFGEVAG